MNSIRDYLCQEARRITDQSVKGLPPDAETWFRQRRRRRQRFLDMMGILTVPPPEERSPLNVRVTGTLERDGYRVEKLYFESLPRLYVAANLYVPTGLSAPAPGVLYVCGHSRLQKAGFQAHPRRFAQLGFVALIVDSIEYAETGGTHHGADAHGQFQWYSRGYTPAGVELWNGIRAIDLLQSRPEVDATRLGVTGISGGGASTWWIAAADDRIRVAAPVCGTGTIASHVADRTVDGHCDCMFFINTYQWDLADVGALIAPRPLLVASADRDGLYSIAAIRECFEKIRQVYSLLGADDNVRLIETPGPHSYHPRSRGEIFSWFVRHLMGEEVSPDRIGDIDESLDEPEDHLRVYQAGLPPDERTTVIHDDFVPIATAPSIDTPADLRRERERVVAELREKSFGHFPEPPDDLDVRMGIRWEGTEAEFTRISFTPEEGWRLDVTLQLPKLRLERPVPLLVYLRNQPGPTWVDYAPDGFHRFGQGWGRLVVETRGTGYTSWGDGLSWHVRRAAMLTGRTIASMRIYDALRAVELARSLPGVDGRKIVLVGCDDMAVVALYTALLDGGIAALVLSRPPGTHDQPSPADGTGPALEILNCLRFTDLPYVAGLLWPTEIVFVGEKEDRAASGERPRSYRWTEELYARLGAPGAIRHVQDLTDWHPLSIQPEP